MVPSGAIIKRTIGLFTSELILGFWRIDMMKNKYTLCIALILLTFIRLYSSEAKTPFEGKWKYENSYFVFIGDSLLIIDDEIFWGTFEYNENEISVSLLSEYNDTQIKDKYDYKLIDTTLTIADMPFSYIDSRPASDHEGAMWSLFDMINYLQSYLSTLRRFQTSQGVFFGPAVFIQWSDYSRVYLQARENILAAKDAVDLAELNNENVFSWGRFYFNSIEYKNLVVLYFLLN